MVKRTLLIGVVLACGFAVGLPSAQAVILDITVPGAILDLYGALFYQIDPTATGTGNINSFVRLNAVDDQAKGYNTTVGGVFDNTSDATHNHELPLSLFAPPIIKLNNVNYREFLLDIAEPGNANKLESLDEIQVFLSSDPNQSVETLTSGIVDLSDRVLLFRLDDNGVDSWIKLDATLNSGNGSGDMFMYIPNQLFVDALAAHPTYTYVYLYSQFGLQGGTLLDQGSFDEWAVRKDIAPPCDATPEGCGGGPGPVVPEPASLLLMGSGLLGLVGGRLRSRRES